MLLGMFWVGAAYAAIAQQTSGYALAIGEEGESDASRLRSLKSFLRNDCSFLC